VEDQLNAKGEDFGRARVQKLLKKRGAQSPKCIASALFHELDTHRDDTVITDDQSVVAMRVC
jgi:serine phosphatase RsbU (regulator of sigma subunit)